MRYLSIIFSLSLEGKPRLRTIDYPRSLWWHVAELDFEPSDFRVHAVCHSTVVFSVRTGLPVRTDPNTSALPCFQGKLCTKNLKKLEPSESFGTYLIPKMTAVHIYLWFVKYIDLSNYIIQIIMYRSSLIYDRVMFQYTHCNLKIILSKMCLIHLPNSTAKPSLS